MSDPSVTDDSITPTREVRVPYPATATASTSTSPTTDQSRASSRSSTSRVPANSTPETSQIPVAYASSTNALPLSRPAHTPRQHPTSLDGILLEGNRDRPNRNARGLQSPSWPTSPRLKSPPPSASHSSARRDSADQAQSNTAAKRLAPVSAPELAAAMLMSEGTKDLPQGSQSTPQTRIPPRGIALPNSNLETVVEGSVPTTPMIDPKSNPISQLDLPTLAAKVHSSSTVSSQADSAKSSSQQLTTENDTKSRALNASKTSSNLAKRSFTSLTGGKKNTTEPVRTLTVETEPVATITTGIGERNRDGGSVRTKTSTETIRPKKEKKKAPRKPATLYAGHAASKADIFEAKVANAVDEVDSDDSDETFVYESNPPEPRAYRHHSRTPSSNSMASTTDHYKASKHGIRTGSAVIPAKKSMKFGNSMQRGEFDDDPSRAGNRNPSTTSRPHHIGRYGRNHHPSIFDGDSPFAQNRQNSPRSATGQIKSPRPSSPRISNGRIPSPRKYGGSAYDNGEDIADDERAPLIGTVRVNRNRHSRRPHSRDFRSLEFGEDYESTVCSRWCGWLSAMALLLLVCCGIGTFVVAVNRPLLDVEIRRITNVLASEQELMLDLDVSAVNPNLFAVTITELDVNIFAESSYVGTSMNWSGDHRDPRQQLERSRRRRRGWFWPEPDEPAEPKDGVDEGTDPDDPEGVQKMLLGRVCAFDSPLIFEPTPIRRTATASVGEIRVTKPGNKTEVGGSERWERVQLHDFDLIVRGVIKYQLPFSSKLRSAKVSGRKLIHPDGEDKHPDSPLYS